MSDIIVTGSRVARPDYVANSPIVSVSTEAIEDTGQVSVERALTQLPHPPAPSARPARAAAPRP
ncbi:hypothetical protein V8F63_13240 [Brevundimonas sp. LF-1]|uniref:hypothetical protein n=1 Tax=Brevundimonas sp. LF-1 TaxID=3126100 RepID=UPI0030DF0C7D